MQGLYTVSFRGRARRMISSLIQAFVGHPVRRILPLLALLGVASSPLLCQQFATLNLTVADPAGRLLPQASVSARSTDTGVVHSAVSDHAGLASIPGLPAGAYRLTVDATGFSRYEAPLTLTLGEIASLQVSLHVGTATEQIEVQDTAAGVEQERTEGGQVIERPTVQISSISNGC